MLVMTLAALLAADAPVGCWTLNDAEGMNGGSVVADPTDPAHVVIAPSGTQLLFESNDSAESWHALPAPKLQSGEAFEIVFASDGTFFAGAQSGLFRFADGSFSKVPGVSAEALWPSTGGALVYSNLATFFVSSTGQARLLGEPLTGPQAALWTGDTLLVVGEGYQPLLGTGSWTAFSWDAATGIWTSLTAPFAGIGADDLHLGLSSNGDVLAVFRLVGKVFRYGAAGFTEIPTLTTAGPFYETAISGSMVTGVTNSGEVWQLDTLAAVPDWMLIATLTTGAGSPQSLSVSGASVYTLFASSGLADGWGGIVSLIAGVETNTFAAFDLQWSGNPIALDPATSPATVVTQSRTGEMMQSAAGTELWQLAPTYPGIEGLTVDAVNAVTYSFDYSSIQFRQATTWQIDPNDADLSGSIYGAVFAPAAQRLYAFTSSGLYFSVRNNDGTCHKTTVCWTLVDSTRAYSSFAVDGELLYVSTNSGVFTYDGSVFAPVANNVFEGWSSTPTIGGTIHVDTASHTPWLDLDGALYTVAADASGWKIVVDDAGSPLDVLAFALDSSTQPATVIASTIGGNPGIYGIWSGRVFSLDAPLVDANYVAVDNSVSPARAYASASSFYTYVLPVAPTVASVIPASAAPGSKVQIFGTSFCSGSVASFGGLAAATTFVSDSEIDAEVPQTNAGTVSVGVLNLPGRQGDLANAFTVVISSGDGASGGTPAASPAATPGAQATTLRQASGCRQQDSSGFLLLLASLMVWLRRRKGAVVGLLLLLIAAPVAAAPAGWQAVGPEGGNVAALDAATLSGTPYAFASINNYYVYVSSDDAASWTRSTLNIAQVNAFAHDTADGYEFACTTNGVFRFDGNAAANPAAAWTQVGSTLPSCQRIVFDGISTLYGVFAAPEFGGYAISSAGLNQDWQPVAVPPSGSPSPMTLGNPGELYAAGDSAIYRYDTALQTSSLYLSVPHQVLALAYASPFLYVSDIDSVLTIDTSVTPELTGPVSTGGDTILGLTTDAQPKLYAGGFNGVTVSDAVLGLSFTPLPEAGGAIPNAWYGLVGRETNAVVVSATRGLLAATDAGVYVQATPADPWLPSNDGMHLASVLSLAVDRTTTPATLYAGTEHQGVVASTTHPLSFNTVDLDDFAPAHWRVPSADDVAFHGGKLITSVGPDGVTSEQSLVLLGGTTWTAIPPPVPTPGSETMINLGGTLFATSVDDGAFASPDGGTTWNPAWADNDGSDVVRTAFDGTEIYLTSYQYVWRSGNLGQSWEMFGQQFTSSLFLNLAESPHVAIQAYYGQILKRPVDFSVAPLSPWDSSNYPGILAGPMTVDPASRILFVEDVFSLQFYATSNLGETWGALPYMEVPFVASALLVDTESEPHTLLATTQGLGLMGLPLVGPITLSSVAPLKASDPILGGTKVAVFGSNFYTGQLKARVFFGGAEGIDCVTISSSEIDCELPGHVGGVVNVGVTNPAHDGLPPTHRAMANALTYETAPAPSASGVAPSTGSTFGGTAVTITGGGFLPLASVTFDGLPGIVAGIGPTSITVRTPAHASGAVDVSVINADGQSASIASAFQYVTLPAPTLTSVSPSSGPVGGGAKVVVTGSGFSADTLVRIGSGVFSQTLVSSTEIDVVTMTATAGVVDVTASNPGEPTATLSGAFTYTGDASVSAAAPAVSTATSPGASATALRPATCHGSGSDFSSLILIGFIAALRFARRRTNQR